MTIQRSTMMLNMILRRAGRQAPLRIAAPAASFLISERHSSQWLACRRNLSSAPQKDDADETESSPLDAFQTLNLERSFLLDPQALKASYRRLMADLHPDKHGQKALSEQLQLQQQASEVTQSYQILKEPNSRATHLLQLMGKLESTVDADESLTAHLLDKAASAQLLMQVMDIREEVDEADSDEALQPLWDENQQRVQETCEKLDAAFREEDLDAAVELTVQLQYWNKIGETIREKMGEMN